MFDDKKIHDLLLQANMLVSKNKEDSFAKIEEALALVKQGLWFSPHTKWQTINRFAGWVNMMKLEDRYEEMLELLRTVEEEGRDLSWYMIMARFEEEDCQQRLVYLQGALDQAEASGPSMKSMKGSIYAKMGKCYLYLRQKDNVKYCIKQIRKHLKGSSNISDKELKKNLRELQKEVRTMADDKSKRSKPMRELHLRKCDNIF